MAVVVNDDVTQLKLLSALLTKGGFRATSFTSAAEALAHMHQHGAPDIVVTDLYMPELDGWRFCRLLRSPEYKQLNAIPVMVISATFSGEATSRITTELGADAFLSAPVDGRELIETANALLQGDRLCHPARVLIATDDPALSEALENIFAENGYEPLPVPSFGEIQKTLEKGFPDVFILEHHLLDDTGNEIIDELHSQHTDCVCVIIADDPNPELALSWMRRGAAAYLRKPFAPEYLIEVCARARREMSLLRVEDLLDRRARAEREHEKHTQSIFRAAPVGIGVVVRRVFTEVNDKFCAMTGYAREELIGRTSRMIYPSDADYEFVGREKYRQIESSKTATGTVETRFLRKDGNVIDVLLSSTAIDPDDPSMGITFTALDITERKRMETELRESRQLLRDVLDTVPVRVFWKDRESRYLGCNLACARDAGLSRPNDVVGKDDYQMGWKDQAEKYRADDKEVMESGYSKLGYEETQSTPSGGLIWLRTNKVPLRNEQGDIIGVLGTYEDITEQKRISHALHINAEQLSLSLKAGRVGIWEFWPFQDKVFFNETWFTILGYAPDEMPQHYNTWRDLLHPDDQPLAEAYVQKHIQTGSDFDLQFRMKSKNGEWRWIQACGYVVERAQDGKAEHITGTHTDITERKLAEIALRESEERFRGIYEISPVGIAVINTRTQQFIEANEGFLRIVGYTLEELRQLTVKAITHPEDWPREQAYNQDYTAGKFDKYELEKRFVRKDGEIRHVIVAADFLHFGKPPRALACGTIVDITERKQAEEERESLQEQLIQAQKMESIGRLAGGVAHDFNNMLAVILGQTEMALEQIAPESQLRKDLQEIELAAQRSVELTRQLLAFARKQTVSPKTLVVNDAVENMLKMLKRLLGENIELVWNPGENLWPVLIDPSQMDQILINMAVNAHDAIAGPGQLRIETGNMIFDEAAGKTLPGISPGEYVQLSVSDTGCGIDEKLLEHIFEPFFTTKAEGRGTGLGLSTVYGAVKQNGGHITVESAPGKGTRFRIFLPRAQDSQASAVETSAYQGAASGETVLLVEDEPAILQLTRRVLEKYGYTALTAASAQEALAMAEKHAGPIHLLLTDVVMPGMNGRDLFENIRLVRPDIKVLYMSGYTGDTLLNHGVNNTSPDFLQKPFSIKILVDKIRERLDS